jgi:Ca2+-binding RTX toxin-like protein
MPLTIFFSSPGTYTIDDDGIRGNNTSVVRDSAGNILFPFVHPGDDMKFIAEVPGVNFIFNVLDSFGTANVTVGSLTDAAMTPDTITVRNMRSDAFITLVANGAINEGGSDPAADILAAGLIMSAGTGIGTGNAIETQVTFIEAETNTGGINLVNSGSVQIGGLTADVSGLDVATSGDINFTTTGFILVADGTGAQSIHGGNTSGNVNLTALGPDSDIFSNINQHVISAPAGGVTLNAGRDIIFGTSGTNFDNDVLSTGPITIRAGRDFQLDGTSDIRTGAFGGVVGGAIDIQAGRNINLSNLTGGLQTIQAFQGNLILTTGPGAVFFENAAFPGAVQTTGDIILTTDNAQINSGGLNTTGIGSVTIRPVTPGRAIDLGTALDGPAALGLSDDEFDLLFTLNVNIGDANTGPIQVSAPLTPFIVDNLTLRSSSEILVNSSIALPRSLILHAGDDIYFTATGSFASTNETLVAFVDEAQDDGGAGGVGNLGGTITVATPVMLQGNVDADVLAGSGANDTIFGNGGNDILSGLGGNDSLNGGLGVDIMNGGPGDDFFFVDGADSVAEAVGEGNDRVFAGTSYVLTAGASVETLSTNNNAGTVALNLTGNALAQAIIGNAGANTLDSGGGGDTMFGFGGNDLYVIRSSADRAVESAGAGTDSVLAAVSFTLEAGSAVETLRTINEAATTAINLTGNALTQVIIGNAGANMLDSGGGGDAMAGLGGDDFYFIRAAGDRAIEAAASGTDRVFAALSFALEAGSSIETLSTTNNAGTTAINLTGNALTQIIFGNAGANTLDSGGGGDAMAGLGGDDFYFVRAATDRAMEAASAGNDRVFAAISFTLEAGSAVETLSTIFNAGTDAINLTGNELAQTVIGNAGANILDGKGGLDTLSGFGGADGFAFTTALGAGNVDRILDFQAGIDKIQLENAIFTGLAAGALPAGAFVTGTAAADASDRIIYNNATGALLFDVDGVGGAAAVQFATLQSLPAISAADFVVI